MEVIVLGAGTGIPHPQRSAAGYFLKIGRSRILMDAGSGTIYRLARAGEDYTGITHLFFSHLHPDHVGDLVPFLFALCNTRIPGGRGILVHGPVGLLSHVEKLKAIYGKWIVPPRFEITYREIPTHGAHEEDFDDFRLQTQPMTHSIVCNGHRFTDTVSGRSVAYSGDTDSCENLVTLCRDADLALLESSFPDELKVEGHMVPSEAGQIAERARCRKLVLTHRYPECDGYDLQMQCRRYYSGELAIAGDLDRWSL